MWKVPVGSVEESGFCGTVHLGVSAHVQADGRPADENRVSHLQSGFANRFCGLARETRLA